MNDLLALAKSDFARGSYATALRTLQKAVALGSKETAERDCLRCECLQFGGAVSDSLALAERAISRDSSCELKARYWGVIGRIHLEEARRREATEALSNGIRAAKKTSDLVTLASLQQLWLVAAGETLGSGLASAVREAYRTAVRSTETSTLAGFHIRLARLEGQRGAFELSEHHLNLAGALLERSPHLGLQAICEVNRAALLATVGAFNLARKSGEDAVRFAEEAGHKRLVTHAATTVAYLFLITGKRSGAEYWLHKAKSGVVHGVTSDVTLLDNFALMALMVGDLGSASKYIAEARRVFDSREHRWAGSNEVLTLFTELQLHQRLGDRDAYESTLATIRSASETIGDRHSQLLAELAEARLLFDSQQPQEGARKTSACLSRSLQHQMYFAPLARLLARDLWTHGRHASAKRMLARAASSALLSGTRFEWADAIAEMRAVGGEAEWERAYSLDDQFRQAEQTFASLAHPERTWFDQPPTLPSEASTRADGFEDALGILFISGDPVLRGREALASVASLDLVQWGALVIHSDAGIRPIASVGSPIATSESLLKDPSVERIAVGRIDSHPLELLLKPHPELSASFGLNGIRRLLEAAQALEARREHQQRLGALWQPEVIIEEPSGVFSSPQMIELMQTAKKVAATTLPVLLVGDTGTGKEVLARAVHGASPRANKTFLPFNCSAVPRDMVESQLFGFRKGSFTGADSDFLGIIRSAEGGTLFLDEIGELSLDLQPKLLRFLETNEVHPLGEGKPIKVDVRVIAATNADLDDLIQRKLFREDLYYRLNIVQFQIPRLSDRREEIPPLAMHLVRRFEVEEKKHSIKLSDELMEYLLLYKWPGNVRQLANELRKMVAMVNSGDTLTAQHLAPAIRATRRTVEADPQAAATGTDEIETRDQARLTVPLDQPMPDAVAALERAMIEHAIARADGRIEEAARLLGISRKGLFLKRRRWQGGDTPAA